MAATRRKRLKPGDKTTLKLTVDQVDLIVQRTLIDDNLIASIHKARVRDDIVSIKCTPDDLGELAGYVAAEANSTKDRKLRQQLDAISDEIDRLSLSYVESQAPKSTGSVVQPRLRLVKT